MVMNVKPKLVVLLLHLLFIAQCLDADTYTNPCGMFFTKLTACLRFTTGKIQTPNKECCDSVSDINIIQQNDMGCLCHIIQRIHHGNITHLRIMGVQETLLLHLPSACNFANVSVADCPKLLELPPDSPDASIFSNYTNSASPTTPPAAEAATAGIGTTD